MKDFTALQDKNKKSRRSFLKEASFYAIVGALLAHLAAVIRFLMPSALKQPARRFKLGTPQEFAQGSTFIRSARVFIVRQRDSFYAMSAICTHLGCTVNKESEQKNAKVETENVEFDCPCHGSKYDKEGKNITGPAPRPLDRYKLFTADDDGQLVVDLKQIVDANFRLNI